uniref:Latent-transforming growth factor beta-binding protein 4 n=1 Tax=Anabas testudineus TaxID=64144 RepID=A0A7N6F8T4_ANATE
MDQRITRLRLLSLPILMVCVIFSAAVGNHTGRIKVVFTPTICKITCIGGRCQNNCELGNTTTIISENGRATDTLTAPNFRVVVCHLPCMNGGKCSTRDKCQCPPNFSGKFCQIPVRNGHQQHQEAGGYSQTQVHSTHTLPLTYSNGQSTVFSPSIVNIHIKHPPEASVQVHQVSQLDNYHNNGNQVKGSQFGSSASYTYHHTESSQKIQHHSYNIAYPNRHTLGRCFQETAGSQCGKALPGLTKQEQCCSSIGTSWGFHKCLKCPQKPCEYNCPQGYRRINNSLCQDFDECQLQGVCPNGNCRNTVGSYRCICKPGYVPDSTFTTCISNTPAIPEEKGACFRLVSSGRQCLHPVSAQLSKQLCCCSVGKAWGPRCDKCPPPGTGKAPEPHPTFILCQGELNVDECQINPHICGQGICYNTAEGYTCHCDEGYRLGDAETTCVDVDECLESPSLCFGGYCKNTQGNFLCVCPQGFLVNEQKTSCVGKYSFVKSHILLRASCFSRPQEASDKILLGYLTFLLERCYNIDECVNKTVCPSGICINVPGSYDCGTCPSGFLAQGGQCVDQLSPPCTNLNQKPPSYSSVGAVSDIDECQDQRVCTRGHCHNTKGSFICQCGPGFRLSKTGDQCDDVDECADKARLCDAVGECVNNIGSYTCTCPLGYRQVNDINDAELCSPYAECLNTEGSYLCLCERGFVASHDTTTCDDIDECGLNETLCGPHGYCENMLGSFRCLCDQGYQESEDSQACVDVNECELLSSVCGEAQCMNMDGSYKCVCPSGYRGKTDSPLNPRKECYYHLNDENLCESVLTSHATLQECCCTLGAGWGDNCEVHPCPVNGTDQYNQMCPSGRGFIPRGELTPDSYKDADECALFGQEVCKGGFCLDTVGSYECYCKTGQDYDTARLECRDINECQDDTVCIGGECLNTDGSYICFCTHPMVLDPSSSNCVLMPESSEQHEEEQTDYQGICWQVVTETMTCTQPLGLNRKTTYTECCCLYGQAWGMDCALCPLKNSEDYAAMCNLPLGGGQRLYGHDALVADSYKAFEGLQAEECGILSGCENGRCVRVQEGYTCDCFDGYTLDLSRMACVDVNECSELNTRMSLCKNAKCINTVGSYQCECLLGFTVSDKPNYCVEAAAHQTHTQRA